MEQVKTVTLTPSLWARLVSVEMAMRMHIITNGGMMLTRTATPATLRAIATEFTGKTYPRSRKGLEQAQKDCQRIIEAVRSRKNGDDMPVVTL